jgi:hypothetical protein
LQTEVEIAEKPKVITNLSKGNYYKKTQEFVPICIVAGKALGISAIK